jgi:hypothetical protein
MEDGCCGVAPVVLSLFAYDVEVEVYRKENVRFRRVMRIVTAGKL